MFSNIAIGDLDDEDEVDIKCGEMWTDIEELIYKRFGEEVYIATHTIEEKGNLINCTFEIDGEFDKAKLMFFTIEDWRTLADKISDVTYDGKKLENDGGDYEARAVYSSLWKYGE